MDEIEFKRVYNEACNATEVGNTGKALMLICQMLIYLDQRITEMQEQEDC